MNFLTRFSLKNPAAIIIMIVLVTLGGVFSALGLKKETMPDISIPVIAVITPYPGASPTDILNDVTKPVEAALKGVSGIDTIQSTSAENASGVIAQFSFSTDMDEAKRLIDEAIKKVDLPEGAIDSQVMRISVGSFPVLKLSFSNEKLSAEELEEVIETLVVKDLSNTEGVGQAQLASDTSKSVSIKLLPDKLKEYKTTSQLVIQQLQAHNINMPIGSVTLEDTVNPIKVSGDISSLEELKNIQIAIYPDSNEQMQKAFEEIGEGMATLGEAVGQVGSAVGQLGQGMSGMAQGLNGENQLLSAIHDTESQLLAAKLSISEAKQTLKDPAATEQEKIVAQSMIEQGSQQIQMGEAALAKMKAQLKEIQKQFAESTKSSGQVSESPKPKQKESNEEKPEIKLVPLSELAEVSISSEEASAYSRINGKNSVAVDIIKAQDGNTVDVVSAVNEKVESIKDRLPEGTKVDVIFDQSIMVKDSVNSMVKEGVLGAIFACIVILMFLRNGRSTLISVISIPLSILITLVFLKQADITLNVLTLGALAMAVGRVVDDSIVVIENVYRHLQESVERDVNIIKVATKEVGNAILSSTLTTSAVFLPLGMVEGMVGVLFKPFAFTVVIALLSSLFVAVTVVPMLAKFLLLNQKVKQEERKESKFMNGYKRTLTWSLNHKFITLLLAVLMFGSSLALIPVIGTSFMPSSEENYLNIKVTYPVGTHVDKTNEAVKEIEKLLNADKEVKMYQTTVGAAAGSLNVMGGNSGSNEGTVFVELDKEANIKDSIKKYQSSLNKLTNKEADITVTQTSVEGSASMNSLEVVVTGPNMDKVKETAKTISDKLSGMKGLESVTNNVGESKPEIHIDMNQEKANKEGLSTAQVGGSLSELIGTKNIGTIKVDKENMDVQVGLKFDELNKLEEIREIELMTALGDTIELQDIAQVEEVPGPVSIATQNGAEYASVTASIKDKNTSAIVTEVEELISTLDVPKGIDVKIGGTNDQINESFNQLGLAMAVAIGAVYLIMVITFGEAKAPFAILFSLPLAMIGGLLGLYVANIPLDMPAMIGFLMLIGIVVTNAIVLVDRVQHQRQSGVSVREALLDAGEVRMRPIIMTALATIGALSPLAIGLSKGALMSQSLAVVVIGGLITSTILTLIVVPVVFELIIRSKKK